MKKELYNFEFHDNAVFSRLVMQALVGIIAQPADTVADKDLVKKYCNGAIPQSARGYP